MNSHRKFTANFSSGAHWSCNTGLISIRQIDVVHATLDNNSSVEFGSTCVGKKDYWPTLYLWPGLQRVVPAIRK